VFIGVHYPSDVTAGFGFGMWFAFATAVWFSRFGLLFRTEGSALRLRV
jgi:undecaprenyl-diphosphatase